MTDEIVEQPTYMEHIRYFFDEVDLDHMKKKGFDLSTYESLKAVANDVYFQTMPPNANMPPEEDRKWSYERSQTFLNWIRNNHPIGKPIPISINQFQSSASRIRKDARDLDDAEIELLKKAFRALMDKDPSDPQSYFQIAGLHWYPLPFKCKHHQPLYNPWHRAYLRLFEDALRGVPGCENVTLPYWDITTSPPEFLYDSPFDTYTLPRDIHPNYQAGYMTQRYDANEITERVAREKIETTIQSAMSEPIWEDFVTFTGQGIEAAHDSGHGACGITISTPDAASFDPLFWFFHSNWDRLWWEWQIQVGATTLWKFRSTIRGSTSFLEAPLNTLDPFPETSDKTINLESMDITYKPYSGLSPDAGLESFRDFSLGSVKAMSSIHVPSHNQVSVRLKGIDRMEIPGSFRAILEADGVEIARRTFFQSTNPKECDNCRSNAIINLDFFVDLQDIQGKDLRPRIEVVVPEPGLAPAFPLHSCGNPTLNIRHLLEPSQ